MWDNNQIPRNRFSWCESYRPLLVKNDAALLANSNSYHQPGFQDLQLDAF